MPFRYFDDFEKRIPRAEITQIEKVLKGAIKEFNSDCVVTICGSYRRGKEESGDVDMLVTHPEYMSKDAKRKTISLKEIVECLEKKRLITDTISLGSSKFMVLNLKICQEEENFVGKWFNGKFCVCRCRECVGYPRRNLSGDWTYDLRITMNIIVPYFISREVICSTSL